MDLKRQFLAVGIRVEIDTREEKLGYRMRESQTKKIPCTLVVGDQEVENRTVNYRLHGSKETNTLSVEEFIQYIEEKVKNKD